MSERAFREITQIDNVILDFKERLLTRHLDSIKAHNND